MGRPSTRSRVTSLLDAAREAPSALVFEGEAGIGKTTMLREAVDIAIARGLPVLSIRPSPAESVLAYTSLADLLDGVEPAVLDALPEMQRAALDRVRLGRHAEGGTVDQRVVAAGLLAVITALTATGPLVIAIDDLQWLDPSSALVVAFALRRVDGPVAVLGAVRTTARTGAVPWLTLGRPGAVERVAVAPMTLGDVNAMVSDRLGRTFARSALLQIHQISAGNPFYALELARAQRDSTVDAAALPQSLSELVQTRLGRLDDRGDAALLATSCLGAPSLDLIASVTDSTPDGVVAALEAAEAAGVVAIEGHRVVFTHPLLAHGVYRAAGAEHRRAMHRRIAGVVDENELAARHLGLSVTRADADVLRAVDQAAESARHRGAPAAAAELLQLAISLGGSDTARRIRLASHHFDAGDTAAARDLLMACVAELGPGPDRAEALHLLAVVHLADDGFPQAAECFEAALAHDDVDVGARIEMLSTLAWVLLQSGDLEAAVRRVETAVPLAENLCQPYLLSQVLSFRAVLLFMRGDGLDEVNLRRALDLHDGTDYGLITVHPDMQHALLLTWTGDLDRAHREMTAIRSRCVEQGGESELIFVCFHSMLLEIWRGDFAAAAFEAEDMMERALLLGSDVSLAVACVMRSAISGYAGDVDAARRDAAEALAVATRAGANLVVLWQFIVLGFVEVSAGDHRAALAAFEIPRAVLAGAPRATEIIVASFVPDAVEALIELGRLDEAEELIDLLEANGTRLDRSWMLAVGARCRGQLQAARGDVGAGIVTLLTALGHHDRLPMPFERARSLLVLGLLQRRARQKDAAAATLADAARIFESLGTRLWAERAGAELARSGSSRGGLDLTPGERRVAELASAGLTNRTIAAELFISAKTVEANLKRVYRKLDIRSRAELGRYMAGSPDRRPD